ncbi:MAG: NAD-dependent deacylase [Deltaproteobacteria bacterium]|nr:NAD-dependent deacylase [Deltaproteobacteria bacterium]
MEALQRAAQALASARNVLAITGAGISAESGIPTFRGAGGLWEGFRAEELATPEAFGRDPELVWRWYRWRRDICSKAAPNPAHVALVELESRFEEFLLATQNVDGLHPRAGSRKLIEIHGNIDTARCTKCSAILPLDDASEIPGSQVPSCPRCTGRMRPHILWFGETYWPGVLDKAFAAASRANAVLVIGTSAQVWPPAQIALQAQKSGATLIDVNPQPTEISAAADVFLQGKAGDLVPALLHACDRVCGEGIRTS